jgi:hypothetical protein
MNMVNIRRPATSVIFKCCSKETIAQSSKIRPIWSPWLRTTSTYARLPILWTYQISCWEFQIYLNCFCCLVCLGRKLPQDNFVVEIQFKIYFVIGRLFLQLQIVVRLSFHGLKLILWLIHILGKFDHFWGKNYWRLGNQKPCCSCDTIIVCSIGSICNYCTYIHTYIHTCIHCWSIWTVAQCNKVLLRKVFVIKIRIK